MKKLKEAIQKANPSIMNLEFGCVILENTGLEVIFMGKNNEEEDTYTGVNKSNNLLTSPLRLYIKDIKEIIGRPITLADVLIALGEYNSEAGNKTISFRNYYPHSLQFEEGGRLLAVWNLKETLDGQKEETKEALKKLLVK